MSENSLYQKNSDGKFLFIRHGVTDFNIIEDELGEENVECIGKYTDGMLSKKGIQQAIDLQKVINNLEIEKVYCSPLKRALETCLNVFNTHPNKNNIVVEVFPLVTEFLNITYDFPKSLEETKKIYNMESSVKFSWKSFEEIFGEKQNLFYLSFLDNLKEDEYKKFYNIFTEAKKNNKMEDAVEQLVKYKKENKIPTLESFKHIFNRTVEFKKYLIEKHNTTLNDLNKKVVVVAHGGILKFLTSKSVLTKKEINNWPEDACIVGNCELVSIYVK